MSSIGMYAALSGLSAQQAAMNAASQDIANVNTPGYTRTRANMVSVVGGGVLDTGSGVTISSIGQLRDAFLTANANQATADQGQAQATSDGLGQVQGIFSENGTTGLASQMDAFWSSWDTIANNPSLAGGEQTVMAQASTLAQSLNSKSNQLVAAQSNALGQVSSNLATVNQTLSKIADLNTQIVSLGANNANANSLIDQRGQLLTSLSGLAGTTSRQESDGSMTVMSGGMRLVQGNVSDTLTLSSTQPGVILSSLAKEPVPLTGGTIGGEATLARTTIPTYQAQLDSVAASLATTVNAQLASGYTTTGTSGATLPMFTSTGGPITAATIAVNPTLTSATGQLAISSSATGTDVKNAQAMAELGSSQSGPDALYRTVIGKLGLDASGATAAAASATATQTAANAASDSISGVNLDEELANMLQYQQAYQAAAKTLTTLNTTIQSLLAAV
ncbi:flagellar hook-associated protein FlgK [Acidothermaceae bacterium B102]|nr:flagellar hook-associated protein FlgK [Acidothermaceae bacterium B102]